MSFHLLLRRHGAETLYNVPVSTVRALQRRVTFISTPRVCFTVWHWLTWHGRELLPVHVYHCPYIGVSAMLQRFFRATLCSDYLLISRRCHKRDMGFSVLFARGCPQMTQACHGAVDECHFTDTRAWGLRRPSWPPHCFFGDVPSFLYHWSDSASAGCCGYRVGRGPARIQIWSTHYTVHEATPQRRCLPSPGQRQSSMSEIRLQRTTRRGDWQPSYTSLIWWWILTCKQVVLFSWQSIYL